VFFIFSEERGGRHWLPPPTSYLKRGFIGRERAQVPTDPLRRGIGYAEVGDVPPPPDFPAPDSPKGDGRRESPPIYDGNRAPPSPCESGRGGTASEGRNRRGEDPRSVHDEAERASEPKVPAVTPKKAQALLRLTPPLSVTSP
jgi:hypothetical protein